MFFVISCCISSRRLIVACISVYYAHISRPYFRLIVELIDLVLCASFAPTFHPGVIIRIVPLSAHFVQGLCVGCAKDGGTVNDPNNVNRSADVREGYDGVWW